MKKVIITTILITVTVIFMLAACDLISPADLTSFSFDNVIDPESEAYCGFESTDSDGDGIGDYLDADEVVLIEPADGARVATGAPELSMKLKSSDIVASYGFIVSESSDLSSPFIEKSSLTTPSYSIESETLSVDQSYYWTGTVTTVDGSVYSSETRSFRLNVDIDAPNEFSPKSDSLDSTPCLAWNSRADATGYHLQLSKSSIFETLLIDEPTLQNPCYQIETALDEGRYYWRLKTRNSEAWSTWSGTAQLNIRKQTGANVKFSGSEYHRLAVTGDGNVKAWGANFWGQLGDGTTDDSTTPQVVSGLSDVLETAAGYRHSLALRSDCTVWAWGYNSNGELGLGDTDDRTEAERIEALSGIVSICAGYGHSLALGADGTVWAWGSNGYGALGNNGGEYNNIPVQVLISDGETPLSGIIEISCGVYVSAAVDDKGNVWTWGANTNGELGIDPSAASRRKVADKVSGITTAVGIACGGFNSAGIADNSIYALLNDGSIKAWGKNYSGELGNNSTTKSYEPVDVLTISDAASISAGGYHCMAINESGSRIWVWGANYYGQLGLGDTADRTSPVLIENELLTGSTAIGTGDFNSFALGSNGKLYSWGTASYGLGEGTATSSNTPVEITGY